MTYIFAYRVYTTGYRNRFIIIYLFNNNIEIDLHQALAILEESKVKNVRKIFRDLVGRRTVL
jgi:hypothetical protein